MISQINLALDVILFTLLLYRIHMEWLFESGAWLRISLCLAFFWLIIADFDVVSDLFSLPIITPHRGPGFRWIVLIGVLIDLARRRYTKTTGTSVNRIIAEDREKNSDKYVGETH
jgi:hypothetical protein